MVLTVADKTARVRLRAAVKKVAAGLTERDEAIVAMRQEGALLEDIATEAKMSIEGVRKLLHRHGLR